MSKMRVAILGAGTIAERAHIPACRAADNIDLIGIYDPNFERANSVADRYKIPKAFATESELYLAQPDAVSICTPNNTHAPLTVRLLERGIHVLLEKPPTINAAEARLIAKVAETSSAILMPLFNNRFRPEVQAGLHIVNSGELGQIYYARAIAVDRRGAGAGWLSSQHLAGGGAVIDLGVHNLDWMLYLLGYPAVKSVYARTFKSVGSYSLVHEEDLSFQVADLRGRAKPAGWAGDVEESAVALITFHDGKTLLFECAWTLNVTEAREVTEIFGSEGGLRVDPLPVAVAKDKHGYLVNEIFSIPNSSIYPNTHILAFQHFFDCIRGCSALKSTMDQAVQLMEIIDAIYKSADSGGEVQVALS